MVHGPVVHFLKIGAPSVSCCGVQTRELVYKILIIFNMLKYVCLYYKVTISTFCFEWVSNLVFHPEGKLKVLEDRVPRRIMGSKEDEITGALRELSNEEHHNLYSPPGYY